MQHMSTSRRGILVKNDISTIVSNATLKKKVILFSEACWLVSINLFMGYPWPIKSFYLIYHPPVNVIYY